MVRLAEYAEVLAALRYGGVVVHIGTRDEGESPAVRTLFEATFQEDVYDPNTRTTLTRTCSCDLSVNQYDELLVAGAVEDGRRARS